MLEYRVPVISGAAALLMPGAAGSGALFQLNVLV